MALCAWNRSKSAVEIFAFFDEGDDLGNVQPIQGSEERKAVQCAIRESSVNFSPLIACERSVFFLKRANIWMTLAMILVWFGLVFFFVVFEMIFLPDGGEGNAR